MNRSYRLLHWVKAILLAVGHEDNPRVIFAVLNANVPFIPSDGRRTGYEYVEGSDGRPLRLERYGSIISPYGPISKCGIEMAGMAGNTITATEAGLESLIGHQVAIKAGEDEMVLMVAPKLQTVYEEEWLEASRFLTSCQVQYL